MDEMGSWATRSGLAGGQRLQKEPRFIGKPAVVGRVRLVSAVARAHLSAGDVVPQRGRNPYVLARGLTEVPATAAGGF